MIYKCLILDGPKAGTFFETNKPQDKYRFPVVEKTRRIAFGSGEIAIPVRHIEYGIAFRSVGSKNPMFLYTKDGGIDHFFKRDWIHGQDRKGEPLCFLDGVEVHDRKELVVWLERLRNLAESPSRVFINECLYIIEEMAGILGMRQGNAR